LRKEGDVPDSKPSLPAKKQQKKSFDCIVHGPDQIHNTKGCKVTNTKIKKLKGQNASFNNQQALKIRQSSPFPAFCTFPLFKEDDKSFF
jgi:hypothetical protein